MSQEKKEKHEHSYIHEDQLASQKDLKILSLEIDSKMLNMKMELTHKISSMTITLGGIVIACSGILFGLLSYFHR